MSDHATRLTGVVKDALSAHKLVGEQMGRDIGWAVSFGLVEEAVVVGGKVVGAKPGMGWTVMVSMRHPWLGYPDIAMAASLPKQLPPDDMFRKLAAQLLEAVREDRQKALSMPMPEVKS